MTRQTPEGEVKSAVTELLDLYRIFWIRNQSSVQVLEHKGRKRLLRSGRPGMADLLALVPFEITVGEVQFPSRISRWSGEMRITEPVWIEVKAPGGKQSPLQKDFQATVEREKHTYLVVDDVRTLETWLREKWCI